MLKQVHPEKEISVLAMKVLNDLITDLLHKTAQEAKSLTKYRNKKTLTTSDVKTAIRLIFPRELADYANQYGIEAISRFNRAK